MYAFTYIWGNNEVQVIANCKIHFGFILFFSYLSKNHNNINGKRITFKKGTSNPISILADEQHKFKAGKPDEKKSDTLKRKRKHRKSKRF